MIKTSQLNKQDINNRAINDFSIADYQSQRTSSKMTFEKIINVAVAGNPNSGKSTLINSLAGTRLHVGNWPGVTVEKKEALFTYKENRIRLVDLPGMYSMSPYSEDELIARDYLVHERPDIIIDVIDSTNLERNLYLTLQLLELEIPIVVALNIYDELKKKGYEIDIKRLERGLGIKAIPTVAINEYGLDNLLDTVIDVAQNSVLYDPVRLNYGNDIESAAITLETKIKENVPVLNNNYPIRWFVFKFLEGDNHVAQELDLLYKYIPQIGNIINQQRKRCGGDIESIMAERRYRLVSNLTDEVLKMPERKKIGITERIDKIFLDKFLGIPIFLIMMWLVFKLTFDISSPFVDLVEMIIKGPLTDVTVTLLQSISAPFWLVSIVAEGIIGGVGFIFSFVPLIFTMLFFITLLEASGYMARAAFIMDRAMHSLGLHGKAFIPMLMGFGCNVPAIYATRTLENKSDRILAALLIPLMSCGARLPVYTIFIRVFFPHHPAIILSSLYIMGIVFAITIGIIFRKTLFRSSIQETFIMELPPYRLPSFKNLVIHTWQKGKHFMVKAGTYIFAVSIIVWFLLYMPLGVKDKRDSYLGRMGQTIAFIFKPIGFGNWEAASSLVTGTISKEIVVSTMGEIYIPNFEKKQTSTSNRGFSIEKNLDIVGLLMIDSLKQTVVNLFTTFGIKSITTSEFFATSEDIVIKRKLADMLQNTFTPLSAYAFVVFVLLYTPCIVTSIAMKNEFGTWKWFGIAFGYEFALAWIVSFAIYQGGRLLGIG